MRKLATFFVVMALWLAPAASQASAHQHNHGPAPDERSAPAPEAQHQHHQHEPAPPPQAASSPGPGPAAPEVQEQKRIHPLGPMVLVLLALTGITVGFFYARSQPDPGRQKKSHFDLLEIRWFKKFVRWKYFQPVMQVPNLAIFALVIYLGFRDTQIGGQNLATKLTWTIWWAAIIFAFLFVGRLWCAMCPFGALTLWASRLAKPLRRFPHSLRNIWLASLSFVLLTWADEYFGIVGSPRRTAWLVVIVAGVAVAVGLLYQRATFCRYLCPIGGLIGLYSMMSPLELRARDRAGCLSCAGKECYRGSAGGQGCIMLEFPAVMERNAYCNLCGECVKTCPKDNIAFRFRPFAQDIGSGAHRSFDEAFLAVMLVALVFLVTGHMVEPWHGWMHTVSRLLPFGSFGITDHEQIGKLTFSCVYCVSIFLLAPAMLLLFSLCSRWLVPQSGLSLKKTFILFAYMFIPIGLSLHLAHNLRHLVKEGPGIVPVVERTINEFTPFFAGTPNWNTGPLASDSLIYYVQMFIVGVFYPLALYLGWRLALPVYQDRKTALKAVGPMVVLALGFTILNVLLLSQPMAARHVH